MNIKIDNCERITSNEDISNIIIKRNKSESIIKTPEFINEKIIHSDNEKYINNKKN